MNPIFPYEYDLMGSPPYRLKWPDVFEIYRNNEEHLEHWKRYYKSQGYKSWEEWREKYIRWFGLRHLKWDLYNVTSPNAVVSFRGADFRGWRRLTGQKHLRFWEMAELDTIRNFSTLEKYIREFPSETTLIGIRYNGSIFIVDGMHRCAAFALAQTEGIKIESNIKIALGRKANFVRPVFLGKRI